MILTGRGEKSLAIFSQALVNGLGMGCIYAAIALGLCLLFGVMKTINFAHGEFVMLGAYATYFFLTELGFNYFLAFILTMVIIFALGYGIEKAFFRPLRFNMLAGFIFTIGLSTFLMNLGFKVFGTTPRANPSIFPGVLVMGTVRISVERIAMAGIALGLIGALVYMLHHSKLGRAMRAVSQDAEAAQLQGVKIGHMSSLSFGISVALAAAAGSMLGTIFSILPSMGTRPLALAFVIVVVGGLGSVPGTILAAILVGLVENFVTVYLSSALAWGAIFVMTLLVLAFKPEGLMRFERN
jgi:branched-chain amino acid transport system permease protein